MSEQTKNAHLLTPKHLEYFGNVGKINSNIPLNAVSASIHVHIHQGIYLCIFCDKFTKEMVTNPMDTVKIVKVKRLIPLGKLPHFTFTLSCKINDKYVMYYWL